jgi:hypothetical protein
MLPTVTVRGSKEMNETAVSVVSVRMNGPQTEWGECYIGSVGLLFRNTWRITEGKDATSRKNLTCIVFRRPWNNSSVTVNHSNSKTQQLKSVLSFSSYWTISVPVLLDHLGTSLTGPSRSQSYWTISIPVLLDHLGPSLTGPSRSQSYWTISVPDLLDHLGPSLRMNIVVPVPVVNLQTSLVHVSIHAPSRVRIRDRSVWAAKDRRVLFYGHRNWYITKCVSTQVNRYIIKYIIDMT